MRRTALITVAAGAAVAAALFIRAGRHSPPVLLLLMTIWVFVPFAAMIATLIWSRRWPARAQSTLWVATVVVTLGALAAYVYDAFHPRAQAAFMYVMVPPASVTILAIALLVAALSRRTSTS
jgi:hypothetical protein